MANRSPVITMALGGSFVRRAIWTLSGFALGLAIAVAFRVPQGIIAASTDKPSLGVSQQQLPDAIAPDNKLQPVQGQPLDRYVVELNESGATVAIDGASDAPYGVTLTSPYSGGSVANAAIVARQLAKAILGADTQYGEWAGKAIHKCEPGFEVVGECQSAEPNSMRVEVTMKRFIVNKVEVLAVAFRRIK
jgi:hypothetical protein